METLDQRRNRIGNILVSRAREMTTRDDMLKLLRSWDKFILEYPYDEQAYGNRAFILEFLGFYELALNDLQRMIYLNPENPETHVRKGQILLRLEKFENGWDSWEWRRRFTFKNRAQDYIGIDKEINLPYWNGEKIKKGEKLFILFEQGIGDNIQFYRFIPHLKNKGIKIVASLRPELNRLVGYNFKKLGDGVEMQKEDDKFGNGCSYYAFAMSLPHILKMYDLNKIPGKKKYLEVPLEYLEKWKNNLKKTNNKKIGIFWESRSFIPIQKFRNISFKKIKELFNLEAEFHCLQKILFNDEKNKKRRGGGYENLYFWDDKLDDLCDTAALISQMDLVITVDTAVAHLAGALGKPTWILIPYISDYRWGLNRNNSYWYDSVKIFRQKEDYLWDGVINEVKEELIKFF